MMFRTATHAEDVRRLLGDVDDLTLERVLETGATTEEIEEAVTLFRRELEGGAMVAPPSSPRIVEVRAILSELDDDDELDLGISPSAIPAVEARALLLTAQEGPCNEGFQIADKQEPHSGRC